MSKLIDSIRVHAATIGVFAFGVLVGAVFCLPLIPYELPASSAELIGAAFGAIAAVGGAAWLANWKEQSAKAHIRIAIDREFWAFRTEFEQLMNATQKALNTGDMGAVGNATDQMQRFGVHYRGMPKRLKELKPLFHQLGANGVMAYVELSQTIKPLLDLIAGCENFGFVVEHEGDLARHRLSIRNALRQL